MQIYNCDETGISVVHKPGKVVAEMGRHKVYSITSAERGKTHTVLTCVSAAGNDSGADPGGVFGVSRPPLQVVERRPLHSEQ